MVQMFFTRSGWFLCMFRLFFDADVVQVLALCFEQGLREEEELAPLTPQGCFNEQRVCSCGPVDFAF